MSNPTIASRFDEIYRDTIKAVAAYVTAKCKHTADIGDILQETYMELYVVLQKRGAKYITNEKALVFRLAKQRLARYYSALEREANIVSLDTAGGENDDDFHVLSDSIQTEEFVVGQILVDTAEKWIQSKPEDTKKVFYLYYKMGLSIPQIAEALSLGESNVKNKLYRTLKEMRVLLDGKENV